MTPFLTLSFFIVSRGNEVHKLFERSQCFFPLPASFGKSFYLLIPFIICRWYHGDISRDSAERLLEPYKDGKFLMRESQNYKGDYTLCVRCVYMWYVHVCNVRLTIAQWSVLGAFLQLWNKG